MERLRREYNSNLQADDIHYKNQVADFMQEFKQHNPLRVPDMEEGDIYEGPFEENAPIGEREYMEPPVAPPLSTEDSIKFGGSAEPFRF